MGPVRLSKLLAARGVASRREAESAITEGRVTVDGVVVREVVPVDPDESEVRFDGKVLPAQPPQVYYVMYKPKGYITGRNDPKERRSVLDLVDDLPVRVEPVGRLDYDTEGALLLTNDGDLAHALTHPSRHIPKRYLAKVYRTPSDADLKAIAAGVFLDDGRTKPTKVRIVEQTDKTNAWVEITVTEGRNRLVRRIFDQLGHPVSKLRRETFATVSIRGMERGQVRSLTATEVKRLRELAEGIRPSKAGRKKGKGFAIAKPKKRRLGVKNRRQPKPRKR